MRTPVRCWCTWRSGSEAFNESAADLLLEVIAEILALHLLKVPALLSKTLHSTNPIESMFSNVRDAEGNIKRYGATNKMMQRWLAAVLLYSEKGFRRIKGYASVADVIRNIEATEENNPSAQRRLEVANR